MEVIATPPQAVLSGGLAWSQDSRHLAYLHALEKGSRPVAPDALRVRDLAASVAVWRMAEDSTANEAPTAVLEGTQTHRCGFSTALAAERVAKEKEMPMDVVETAFRFVEYVNRQAVEKLAEMMTTEHRFVDPSGAEYVGREVMKEGWIDYFEMCPDYIIHISDFHQQGNRVFLMGQTTGSHLDLPWREEFLDKVIWIADVEGGRLSLWKIVADTEKTCRDHGIPGHPGQRSGSGQALQPPRRQDDRAGG